MNELSLKQRIIIRGEGEPIVLVHGMGGPKIWEPIVDDLSINYKVIIPTLPGFLNSDGIIEYEDELYVDFLEKIRNFLNIKKWSIIGLSMGGRTAINYTLKNSDHVNKMILIDSIGLGYMSPILKIPIVKNIFPKLLYRMLSYPKNIDKLGSDDFVDKESEAFEKASMWFKNLMIEDNVRLNFSRISLK